MNDRKRPVETPREWLRYAEGDLSVAEREMQYEMPAYHTVCFRNYPEGMPFPSF